MKPALMFDRDGTMGDGPRAMRTPQDYTEFPDTRQVFGRLREHGFPVYVVSNQSCIARGLDGGYDFAAEMKRVGADDFFLCPHDAQDHCACRKPEPGLLLQASQKHGFSLQDAYMIGDRWSDMLAGVRAGTHLILVLTGRGKEALTIDREKWAEHQPDYIAQNLADAAEWLIKRHG